MDSTLKTQAPTYVHRDHFPSWESYEIKCMQQDQDSAKSCVKNHGNYATSPSNDIPNDSDDTPASHRHPVQIEECTGANFVRF